MTKIIKLFLILLFVISIQFLTGCGGSEEPEISEAEIRAHDSLSVYLALENSRIHYTKALQFNEEANSSIAATEFESAVSQLSKVKPEILNKYPSWKKDHDELATSVVQDYLISFSNIDKNSKVFDMAKKLNISYEQVQKKYTTNEFNPKDMPLPTEIKLEKNQFVDEYINYFQTNGRKYMDKWLYRAGKYFNLMRTILKENGAPEELVYLAMIESGLDPAISSWAGAIGMWQFMPTTGSAYGLYYDSYTDDKRDVEKATDAAARHLLDLKRNLGDWYLALASYNAGQGRITGAITKSSSTDFWTLRDYLPKETRNYVPQYIAAALITISPEAYGFNDVEWGKPIEYDRAIIKSQITMSRIAELAETDVDKIRELNSQLIQDITPVFSDGYLIKLPKGSFDTFKKNYEAANDFDKYSFTPIYDGDEGTSKVFTDNRTVNGFKVVGYDVKDKSQIISTLNRELVSHRFESFDRLETIAIKYSVRPSDIRIWNHIGYGKYPKAGDTLSIWITQERYKELFGDKIIKEQNKDIVTTNSESIQYNPPIQNNETVLYNEPTVNRENPPVKEEVKMSEYKREDNENILVNKENRNDTYVPETNNDNTYKPKEEPIIVKREEPVVKKEEIKVTTKNEPVRKETIKTVKKENKGSLKTYTVKQGDHLASIAEMYNVSINDIKDWNELESDKILSGQRLKIYSSVKPKTKNTSGSVTYTVRSGDNLTIIANKYGVSPSDVQDWNDLDDDVITEGQKLKIYSDSKIAGTKKNTKARTYKVKAGDNLTAIAEKNGISVSQIREWNGIDDDVIYEGQVLKFYSGKTNDNVKTTKTQLYTVKKGDTLASIAQKFDMSVAELKKINNLKKDHIESGQKIKVKK